MTLDERIEALTVNLALAGRDIEHLKTLAARDGEHIRALAQNSRVLHESIQSLENIARSHEQRISHLEDDH
jgi:uncharacterized coiled-coil protein SlyX